MVFENTGLKHTAFRTSSSSTKLKGKFFLTIKLIQPNMSTTFKIRFSFESKESEKAIFKFKYFLISLLRKLRFDMLLPLEAIAIIGPQNNPLLVKKFNKPSPPADPSGPSYISNASDSVATSISNLKINFISHAMIDIIEERINSNGINSTIPSTVPDSVKGLKQDCYLGRIKFRFIFLTLIVYV